MRFIAFLFIGVVCPILGFAQDMEHAKLAMAKELTLCSGYYFALWGKNRDSAPSDASKALQENGGKALNLAKKYVPDEKQLGQMGGAAAEVVIFMSAKNGWDKTNKTFAEPCKSILENPEKRFLYHLEK
jgi:hypothetical protein